jgi:RNA:NAD 2'-phosphotransferase (TPT1/KptA family)
MGALGHQFFQAANAVWLTSHVPPAFISVTSPLAAGRQ